MERRSKSYAVIGERGILLNWVVTVVRMVIPERLCYTWLRAGCSDNRVTKRYLLVLATISFFANSPFLQLGNQRE